MKLEGLYGRGVGFIDRNIYNIILKQKKQCEGSSH